MNKAPSTIGDACKLAGISYAQARRYWLDGRVEKYDPGVTDFAAWCARLHELQATAPNRPKPLGMGSDSRARYELARAEKLELANAEKRGELLDRQQALLACTRVAAAIRDAIEAIPVRVAPDDFGMRSRIEREVHDALAGLAALESGEVLR